MHGPDPTPAPNLPAPAEPALRALVVDDDPRHRAAIVEILRERGHEVHEFADASSALAAHQLEPFTLMVLDWVLPGMDGLELCRRVRELPGSDALFVLVVTGRGRVSDLEEALAAGASDYIAKPIVHDLLRTRLMIAERSLAEARRRREAEAALRESEANLSALVENTRDAIWLFDADAKLITANAVARHLIHVAYEKVIEIGMGPEDVLPEPALSVARAHLARALAGEQFVVEWEHPMDEITLAIEASLNPIRDRDDRIRGVSVFARNDTERREAAAALERYERDVRQVLENAPDGVFITRDLRLLYANKAFAALLGCAREALNGQEVLGLVHPDDREKARARFADGATPPGPGELRLRRIDGEYVVIEDLPGAEVEFDGKPARVVSARNVTERRGMLAHLLVADRLASMGTLAAGVAHEINNPLGYLAANLDYLSEQLPVLLEGETDPAYAAELLAAVREARQGADRVRAIVSDLNQFARVDIDRAASVSVRDVLESVLQMTSNELRHRARIECDFAEVPPVRASEGRLAQVFVNLLMNAAQALPVGHADHHVVRVWTFADELGRVVVAVSDSGPGIAPEIRDRVFDPFFTTKSVGEGTGLGLSISHAIVASLGGEIRLESRLGEGTTIFVYLPAAPPSHVPALSPSQRPSSRPRRARILVVDDEPLVGRSLARTLAGHDVVVVDSGRQALDMLRTQAFDLVFCDLMMPDVSGMDFYERLAQQASPMLERIVFMTGGAFTARAREFLGSVPNPQLEKPFDMQQIRDLVAARVGS